MSDVPTDAYREILRRVPVDSLYQIRSVCKTFRDIIDDPQFAKLHVDGGIGDDSWIIHQDYETKKVYLFPLKNLVYPMTPSSVEWMYTTTLKPPVGRGVPSIRDFSYDQPCCNGFILITSILKKMHWVIWNPFTGESLKLPCLSEELLSKKFQGVCSLRFTITGFGYDEVNDDYKVVKIVDPNQTFICSVKSEAWRRIQDVPRDCSICSSGVFLKSALHWLVRKISLNLLCILVLDLSTETYLEIPTPSDANIGCVALVAAFSGSLFLSCRPFVVWMIENNAGISDKMWTKIIIPLQVESLIPVDRIVSIMAYWKSKNWLLLRYMRSYMWYDVGKQLLWKISVEVNPDDYAPHPADGCIFGEKNSQVIPASLVHMKRSDGSSKRKRKRAAAEKLGLRVFHSS